MTLVKMHARALDFKNSKVVTLLHGVFTSYAYCCQFGVPCYCSQAMTTAGQCPQISSVVMLTRLASEAN